jgi:hypothetical protein
MMGDDLNAAPGGFFNATPEDYRPLGFKYENEIPLDPEAMSRPSRSIRATEYVWVDPASIPRRRFLFGRLLLRASPTALVAAAGIGKTTFTAGMTLSLVTGRPLLGHAVHEGPQRVWLYNLEDPAEELSRSIQAGAILHNIAPDDLAGRLFVDSAMTVRRSVRQLKTEPDSAS